ncbi:MAG TPA: hypothetical protein VGK06_13805 [Methanosarcina sp.]|jgi:DNA replicative helicase MCM subunit Mcm2 (Cdc46/Mcm family)
MKDSNSEASPVPVTARNVDGLFRLCEAAARMRLSQFVERQDLEFAKKLVTMSLHDMGLDPYTGRLDSGYSNTGISKIKEEAESEIFRILKHEEPDREDLIIRISNHFRVPVQNIDMQLKELERQGEIMILDEKVQLPLNFKKVTKL